MNGTISFIAIVMYFGISALLLIFPITLPYGIEVTKKRINNNGIIPVISGDLSIKEPVSGFLKKLDFGAANAIIIIK